MAAYIIILVDDDNRVVLKPLDEYESDYVNASYVDVSTNSASSFCENILDVHIHLLPLPRDTLHKGSSLPLKVHTSYPTYVHTVILVIRSAAKDCGGFLEASVAGESPHHRDDHQPGGGD